MEDFKLTETETTFILLLRNFDFFRYNGYQTKEFSLCGRYTFLVYENEKIKQKIYFEWAPINYLKIKLIRISLLKVRESEINNLYSCFDFSNRFLEHPPVYITMEYMIKYNAIFIQTHLMPVIRGEMWIDELIKQKNKHKQDTGKI